MKTTDANMELFKGIIYKAGVRGAAGGRWVKVWALGSFSLSPNPKTKPLHPGRLYDPGKVNYLLYSCIPSMVQMY